MSTILRDFEVMQLVIFALFDRLRIVCSVTMPLCMCNSSLAAYRKSPESALNISKDSSIIHNKHFEHGIVKIQKEQEISSTGMVKKTSCICVFD